MFSEEWLIFFLIDGINTVTVIAEVIAYQRQVVQIF